MMEYFLMRYRTLGIDPETCKKMSRYLEENAEKKIGTRIQRKLRLNTNEKGVKLNGMERMPEYIAGIFRE